MRRATDKTAATMDTKIQQQITWVYTLDLEKTASFYRNVLELPEVLDQGYCRVFRVTALSFIGVCQRPDRHVEPKGVMLTLLTKNVDDWHRRLVALGAPVVGEPRYTESSKSYSFVCLDPEGYRLEFQEFRDALWRWPEP